MVQVVQKASVELTSCSSVALFLVHTKYFIKPRGGRNTVVGSWDLKLQPVLAWKLQTVTRAEKALYYSLFRMCVKQISTDIDLGNYLLLAIYVTIGLYYNKLDIITLK
jgi:hypothetical protein